MDRAASIAHLRADSATLLSAQRAEPSAPAWAGLGWDRTELLTHVASVHAWARAQLQAGTEQRVRFSDVAPLPEGDDLADWFEAGVDELSHLLSTMDLDATWPTWAGPQPGRFFPRRMAQETAVHRWDAAGGTIDAAIAVDGIDELLELFAPRLAADRLAGVEGTIHLHATDADGEWLVRFGPDGITFERGHAKGDGALRGRAGDLLLWTWNRLPLDDDRLEILGDPALLEAWHTTVVI
jgi:uncharacterized protein (TIGR03083 family)